MEEEKSKKKIIKESMHQAASVLFADTPKDHPNGIEIIIREGEAERQYTCRQVEVDGDISAPGDFYEHRKQFGQINPEKAIVRMSFLSGQIQLDTDLGADIRNNTKITGVLTQSSDIGRFQLHTKRDAKEMANTLRSNKHLFLNKHVADAIVEQLMGFKGTIITQLESANDLKGSKRELYEAKLSHSVDLKFEVNIRLYTNEMKHTVVLEVMCDIVNGQPVFWLESPEYLTALETAKEMILERESRRFEGLTIIKK